MKVPLLDLVPQYNAIKAEVDSAVGDIFASQRFILGPAVERCEKLVAEYSACAHGVGVSSGTDALLAALMAEGIGAGDEVITSPYTFFATAGSIARLGAKPVFVDIEPGSCNVAADKIAAAITDRTRALIAVHLYGQMADMNAIMNVAEEYGLVVIEDAAQAVGAERDGARAGSRGQYGCLSFFPSKNLGGAGDGGMVVTNDAERAARVRMLRMHGSERKYYHRIVGGNFRLDALQAAVVSVKMRHIDGWTESRRKNAARYNDLFEKSGLVADGTVSLPKVVASRHVFNQYVIRVPRRDELKAFLADNDIGTDVYYPVPLHLQECFRDLGYRAGDFPESERAAGRTLALPVFPELSDEQAAYVVDNIGAFYRRAQG